MLDVVDMNGNPTGKIVSRDVAHAEGVRHRTSHVWLVRMNNDRFQILLQKRSNNKDSYPGCYDISSAGQIPAGVDFIPSALRELEEELGIEASADELILCGQRNIHFDETFHDRRFVDNQVSNVYLLWRDQDEFRIQKEELSAVEWFDFEDCLEAVRVNRIPNCIYEEELLMVKKGAEQNMKESMSGN